MEHQDLFPVIFSNKNTRKKLPTETVAKNVQANSNRPTSIKVKEDEEGDILAIPKFSREFIQEVIQKRVAKGWKQKDLANQLKIQDTIINQFEKGSLNYDGKLVDKIKRVLGKDFTQNIKKE